MKRVHMKPAVSFFVMPDTMPEDFVRLNSGELNYLIGAITYITQPHQDHLETHCHINSTELYAKLFDAWAALETND
jgi:hypothetical protein